MHACIRSTFLSAHWRRGHARGAMRSCCLRPKNSCTRYPPRNSKAYILFVKCVSEGTEGQWPRSPLKEFCTQRALWGILLLQESGCPLEPYQEGGNNARQQNQRKSDVPTSVPQESRRTGGPRCEGGRVPHRSGCADGPST